jgi:hypothetical protein
MRGLQGLRRPKVRFPIGVALLVPAVAAVMACGSSGTSSTVTPESGTACTDSLGAVFNKSQCPVDSSGNPLGYDIAITFTCDKQGLKTGDIEYGQCLNYLVWEQDNDTSGHNFSKCFYDVNSHAFVGVVYADGMQDQCKGKSFTVQGGAGGTEADCIISGLTSGGGGKFESCAPVPEGGADAASE